MVLHGEMIHPQVFGQMFHEAQYLLTAYGVEGPILYYLLFSD